MAARGVYIPARDFGPHHAVLGACRYGNSLTKGGNQRPLDHKRRKPQTARQLPLISVLFAKLLQYDFDFCASMWDNFFSSHIEEQTTMHGLELCNIIRLSVKTFYFFHHVLLFHELQSINFGQKPSNFQIFQKKFFFFKNQKFWSFS